LPLPLLLTHVVVQPVTVIDRVSVPSLFKDGNDVALLDDWLAGVCGSMREPYWKPKSERPGRPWTVYLTV
jgi:hypothetical protein